MTVLRSLKLLSCAVFLTSITASAHAQSSSEELAKKLSNPIASLISVPFQYNYDQGYGSQDGNHNLLNIQPVVPFALNEDWNLISRTILPVTWQDDIAGPSGEQFGLGDTLQSFFFSPARPTESGIIWGVGPAILLPTGTDELLGTGKWSAGPTGVALKQDGPWTFGILANHVWSFAGQSDRADVSSTYLQPFISYTTHDAWTFSLNTESTYDWEARDWSVPINVQVSKVVKFGEQPVSFGVGARYWAQSPEGGPDGWGVRAVVTFLFPK